MLSDIALTFTRRSALAALLVLAACGYVPVYGTDGQAAALRNAIGFDVPATEMGFALRKHLQDRLGVTQTVEYQLSVTIDVDEEPAAIAADNSATRQVLRGSATYRLFDLTGDQVTEGQVDTFVGYSTTGTTVATETARADAFERLANGLGDLIVSRLFALRIEG